MAPTEQYKPDAIGEIRNGKLVWNTDGGPEKWRERKDYEGPIYVAPPANDQVAVLDSPAMVGSVRFGKGVKWSTVIGASQRLYQREVTPEKEDERIKRATENIQALRQFILPDNDSDARIKDLEADNASLLRLITDIRFALGDNGKRMQDELIKYARHIAGRADELEKQQNKLETRLSVAGEVQVISGAYDYIRAERIFAADDLEYDLFAAGWKAALTSFQEGQAQ